MRFSRSYFTPTLYSARLLVRTALEVWLLALLIEGLYLSERFISVLKIVIDKPVGLGNVFSLLALTAPEVYLALPLTILIATYRVVLQYRENREFIALASGGQSTLPLVQFAIVVGFAAFGCSLLISGEIVPRAKFAFRANVDAIRYEALRAGSTPGQFLYFPNYTIYVWPTESDAKRPIFVKQILDDKTYRIISAADIQIVDRSSEGRLIIGMRGITASDLPNETGQSIGAAAKSNADERSSYCNDCESLFKTLRADSVARSIEIKNLTPTDPRGVTLDEWTTLELLGLASAPAGRNAGKAEGAEAVRRFARALLCFLAPFIAWLALTFTTRGSQAFALPLACAAVMSADIVFSQLINRFFSIGVVSLSLIIIAAAAVLLGLLLAQIVARQHLLIFPALGRA